MFNRWVSCQYNPESGHRLELHLESEDLILELLVPLGSGAFNHFWGFRFRELDWQTVNRTYLEAGIRLPIQSIELSPGDVHRLMLYRVASDSAAA